MKCKYCLCEEAIYFKQGVCRRCLRYRNLRLSEDIDIKVEDSDYKLNFKLSKYQLKASRAIVDALKEGDVFFEAVCGAGKTEMCYEVIRKCLERNKRVGWAIPRRQVVLELAERIASNFRGINVIAVCGGYTDILQGDLIICTTHQLFRYHQYFDVLIVDEVDAFPFYNNELLFDFMRASVRGRLVLMSATADRSLMSKFDSMKHIMMPFRPDLLPIPIPVIERTLFSLWKYRDIFKKEKVLVFVPTRKMAKILGHILRVPYITSTSSDKESVIDRFRECDRGILICTTVLERGVTFRDVFVFVIKSDHDVFNTASLIQIAGRIKRGASVKGSCVFLSFRKDKEVIACVEQLESINRYAYSVLNP
jgi:competence protein ComFA